MCEGELEQRAFNLKIVSVGVGMGGWSKEKRGRQASEQYLSWVPQEANQGTWFSLFIFLLCLPPLLIPSSSSSSLLLFLFLFRLSTCLLPNFFSFLFQTRKMGFSPNMPPSKLFPSTWKILLRWNWSVLMGARKAVTLGGDGWKEARGGLKCL